MYTRLKITPPPLALIQQTLSETEKRSNASSFPISLSKKYADSIASITHLLHKDRSRANMSYHTLW